MSGVKDDHDWDGGCVCVRCDVRRSAFAGGRAGPRSYYAPDGAFLGNVPPPCFNAASVQCHPPRAGEKGE